MHIERRLVVAALAMTLFVATAGAQVAKMNVPGVDNFVRVDSLAGIAGATSPGAVPNLKRLGYAAIVDLRQPSEPGASIEAESAAAGEAGIAFFNLPLNAASPDPAVVDRFLRVVADPANQPLFIHCASGNRAAALWLVKRIVVDGWDEERAVAEATIAGLSSPALKTFALDYAASHKR